MKETRRVKVPVHVYELEEGKWVRIATRLTLSVPRPIFALPYGGVSLRPNDAARGEG